MILDATMAQNAELGLCGTTLFSDTTARVAGDSDFWCELVCLTDTTFTLLTMLNHDGTAYTGVTFPKGSVIKGQFIAITLATGSIWALRAGYAKIKTVP
jgi:hypothetical protein